MPGQLPQLHQAVDHLTELWQFHTKTRQMFGMLFVGHDDVRAADGAVGLRKMDASLLFAQPTTTDTRLGYRLKDGDLHADRDGPNVTGRSGRLGMGVQLQMTRVIEEGEPWARFLVTEGQKTVGFVVEEHVWRGHRSGPATYEAVHSPSGEPRVAWWRSGGHASPQAALAALADHIVHKG